MIFALSLLLLVVGEGSSQNDRENLARFVLKVRSKLSDTCPPVNNIPDERACWLRFSQLTLPGSHNSAAREDLKLALFNMPVPDCKHQNQKLTITQQLELGVRSLDIDVAYKPTSGASARIKDNVRVVHCGGVCAYGMKLEFALTEVAQFLEKNKHEILMIRIVDYKVDDETERALLTQSILEIVRDTIGIRRLNYHTDPLIASALVIRRNVFFYLNTDLWVDIKRVKYTLRKLRNYIRPHKHLSTWFQLHQQIHLTCDLKPGAMTYFNNSFNQEIMRNFTWLPIISDWYDPGMEMGICLTDSAEECRKTIGDNIELARYLQHEFNRTINVLMTDFTGVKTVETAQKMNLLNMDYFVTKKQGHLSLDIAFSNHMTKYPFKSAKQRYRRHKRLKR
ncbi:hypothetical protein ACHWQZ_G016490 [Mnemiopsis leidyi]